MEVSSNDKTYSAIGYLGILVLVPILAGKDSGYCKFHANNSLLLLIGMVASWILSAIIGAIGIPFVSPLLVLLLSLVSLALGIFALIGLIYAATGKKQAPPLMDKLNITLIK